MVYLYSEQRVHHGMIVIPVSSETVLTTFPLVSYRRMIPRSCGADRHVNRPSWNKAGGELAT